MLDEDDEVDEVDAAAALDGVVEPLEPVELLLDDSDEPPDALEPPFEVDVLLELPRLSVL